MHVGADEQPIVDQGTYLGVEISPKDCFWDAHIAKVVGKGKSQVGNIDAILQTRTLTLGLLDVF